MTSDNQRPGGVFARGQFERGMGRDPRLTQPNSPWTMIFGVSALAILAVGVFTSLSQARASRARDEAPIQVSAASPQPAPAAAPTGPAQAAFAPPPPIAPTAPARPQEIDPHLRAPAMVVDLGDGPAAPVGQLAQAGMAPNAPAGAEGQLSADERFAARVMAGGAEAARASQLRDLTRIVPQGSMIPAVLETAIDSDLPGGVRAVVSRDVRSFDGSRVLIPRGSKLIGQYRSAAAIGQTRAFVIWSRLLTPSGVSVDIGSPAADELGRGGLTGDVDSHFFRRFGASILLTVLSAGADAIASRHAGGSNTLIIGSPAQATNVANIALQKQIDIPTTIRVAQGTPLQVSVARDLDFSGVSLAAR